MSGRVVSDIQTRAEGESLYIRYNTDANVVNNLKNDSSYEFIGEVIFKINVVQAEKIKVKVYVNQHESVSHIQIRHAYDFSLCFLHELLMSFLIMESVSPRLSLFATLVPEALCEAKETRGENGEHLVTSIANPTSNI